MADPRSGDERVTHVCPGCGSAVECGMTNGDDTCWCFELPHMLPASGVEASCYCKACLEGLIAERQALAAHVKAGSRS
jgi:cysteine-rich CWC protein